MQIQVIESYKNIEEVEDATDELEIFEEDLSIENRKALRKLTGFIPIMGLPDKMMEGLGGASVSQGGIVFIALSEALMNEENFDLLVETLVHEMCHCRQLLDGRLDITSHPGQVVWEGTHYPIGEVNPRHRSYLDLPWEREAHIVGLEHAVACGRVESVEAGWNEMLKKYDVL